MIARIEGRLEQVTAESAMIDGGGGLWYEVLIPAGEVESLKQRVGREIVLHTIHYIDGDPTRGWQAPRLVGFLHEEDRAFFRLFTKVKGIGIRKALRALARPVGEVAAAIVAGDEKLLKSLPEIGARTAQQIIAELSGKVDAFAGPTAQTAVTTEQMPEAAIEAIAVLVQLGEKRPDAAALVERVLAVAPDTTSTEAIIQHVYRLKGGGGVPR